MASEAKRLRRKCRVQETINGNRASKYAMKAYNMAFAGMPTGTRMQDVAEHIARGSFGFRAYRTDQRARHFQRITESYSERLRKIGRFI
jgi:hypothetical protein